VSDFEFDKDSPEGHGPMDLRGFRKRVVGLTQADIARALGVTQSAVSQLESRKDALLSRLDEFARALGAELEIWLVHHERRILIDQFQRGSQAIRRGRKPVTPRPEDRLDIGPGTDPTDEPAD